jgi:hypothetical protein
MSFHYYDKELKKMVEGHPPPPVVNAAPFYIMPMFQEYRAVGVDNRIVKTRTDHKNMLKDHGFTEVGNEQHASIKQKQEEWAEGEGK